MALLDAAIQAIYRYVDTRVESVRPFRAIVIGQANGMVQIRRIGDPGGGETALRARVAGFDLETNDEVLCSRVTDGIPVVVGKLQRSVPSAALTYPGSAAFVYAPPPVVVDGAVTGSNSSTSTYAVNVQTSITLPGGTWDVYAWGGGLYYHSSANDVVRVHMQIGSDAGDALTSPCPSSSSRMYVGIANHATGQSGSIDVKQEYRPNASGTAYAGGGWLMVVAFRTS